MKKLFNRRLVKRSLYTGGVVGPTGGLIHYLVNDKSQELSDELTKSNLQVELLSKEKDSLTKENEDLKQELLDELTKSNLQIALLSKEKDSLTKENEDLKQEINELEEFIERWRESFKQKANSIKSLVKEINDLKEEVSKQKKYNEEKSQTIIEYSNNVIELKGQIEFLKNKLHKFENEVTILKDCVKDLLVSLSNQEELHIEKLNTLMEMWDKDIKEQKEELNMAENWITQLEGMLEPLLKRTK